MLNIRYLLYCNVNKTGISCSTVQYAKVQDKLATLAKLQNMSYRLDEKRVFRVMFNHS